VHILTVNENVADQACVFKLFKCKAIISTNPILNGLVDSLNVGGCAAIDKTIVILC